MNVGRENTEIYIFMGAIIALYWEEVEKTGDVMASSRPISLDGNSAK